MPRYRIGGVTVRRKNWWLPCVIAARTEEMSEQEYAATLKATWWADLITDAEWKALLRHAGFSPSARSRLKKKAAGWLLALGRISVLNPALFDEIRSQAERLYPEQVELPYPLQVLYGVPAAKAHGLTFAEEG